MNVRAEESEPPGDPLEEPWPPPASEPAGDPRESPWEEGEDDDE